MYQLNDAAWECIGQIKSAMAMNGNGRVNNKKALELVRAALKRLEARRQDREKAINDISH